MRPLIQTDVPLASSNSLGLAATARQYARIEKREDLVALHGSGALRQGAVFILGGGTNLVLRDPVEPLVLAIGLSGVRIRPAEDHVIVEASAGENWNDLVGATLEAGHGGLENLIAIPGSAGAAPVQNIGAYGLELDERLRDVEVFDLQDASVRWLPASACAFGYRDSMFKRHPGRFVILTVRLALPRPWRPVLHYGDLATLDRPGLTPHDVARHVAALRARKLPDPAVLPNAGSFFKNPLVSADQFTALKHAEPGLVAYPQADGRYKLAAAWLIEACGWKGRGLGPVAVHHQQALVLVNRGGASAKDVLALADAVVASVRDRFAVELEREPVLV